MPKPQYVYMMQTRNRLFRHISHSHSPSYRVLHHNIFGTPKLRSTKDHGQWELTLVLGTFYDNGARRLSAWLNEHPGLDAFTMITCLALCTELGSQLTIETDHAENKCDAAQSTLSDPNVAPLYLDAMVKFCHKHRVSHKSLS